MNKYNLIKEIEKFAPLDLQEKWDCSGWIIETSKKEIKKVLIALTVTIDVFNQAKNLNCDMIISHHPMFFVPINFKNIDIYCAHTNMDKSSGGTTDTLIKELGFKSSTTTEFLRIVDENISIKDLSDKIKKISPNAKIINNYDKKNVSRIAFCAGSGMDLYHEAIENHADCFITGDLKYHNAIDSEIVLYDIGHFESEILIKKVFQGLIENKVEVILANEKSPFKNI